MKLFNIKLIENFKIFKFKNLYSSSNPKADYISKQITEITNSLKNEFIVRVEIDTGNLVTKRVKESGKTESKNVSYGGTYMTLKQSRDIVRKINEEKNIF